MPHGGNLLDRQQQIDKPGCDCARRHLSEAWPRQVGALGYGQPAIFFDRLEAESAVAAAPREHNADRSLSLIFGERLEKDVDGGSLVIGSPSAVQSEPTLVDGQGRVRWQNMNLLWLNHLTVSGVEDRHRRGAAQA